MSREEVLKKFADPDALRKVSELWSGDGDQRKKNIRLKNCNHKE